jgi:hypothetical protein
MYKRLQSHTKIETRPRKSLKRHENAQLPVRTCQRISVPEQHISSQAAKRVC